MPDTKQGSCRWLRRPQGSPAVGLFRLTDAKGAETDYHVEENLSGGVILGWRLEKWSEEGHALAVYDLEFTGHNPRQPKPEECLCDCPSGSWRPERPCKHKRALCLLLCHLNAQEGN